MRNRIERDRFPVDIVVGMEPSGERLVGNRASLRLVRSLAARGHGIVGAGERFSVRFSLRVASRTGVMVERAVARTRFAASVLLRESLLRGLEAAVSDLAYRIREARRAAESHPPLAILGRVGPGHPLRYGRLRLNPWTLLGDTP